VVDPAPDTGSPGILATWRGAPAAARALLLGIFVNRLGAFIQVFLVLFLTHRGFSEVQAGTALGVFTAGAVAGVIVGGALSDRLGPRVTILLSMVGGAVLVVSILYLRQYPLLLVVVFATGLVGGAYRPAAGTLLSELTPPDRQVMIFAMYRLAYNLGNTAAPLIGAALLAASYDLLFWGEAVAALGYGVIAAVALPRRGREPSAAAADEQPGDRTGYAAVAADRRYVLFLFALLVNAIVYVQYLSALPVAMRDAGLATGWFSLMVAINGTIVITCELLITKVVQRWPMRVVVAAGFVLLGGGMAFYALPLGLAGFLIGTLVWSLAEIVAGPTVFAYPAIASPGHLRGRYIGAANAMFGIGSASGAVIGLALWSAVGKGVWVIAALTCVLGLFAAWFGMHAAAGTTVAAAEEAESPDPEPLDDVPAAAARTVETDLPAPGARDTEELSR
jgi:MFS family permease